MVLREKIKYHNKRINRVACPKARHEDNSGNVSFDKCKKCKFSDEIFENSVECSYPVNSPISLMPITNNKMKIAFTGTHCCGKTTIAEAIKKKLEKLTSSTVGVLPEVVRLCKFNNLNEETDFDSQFDILTNHIAYEQRYAKKYDILLCDRSVIDNLAYSLYAMKVTGKILPEDFTFMRDTAVNWQKTHKYRLIFYLGALPLNKDNFRSKNSKYQKEIDVMTRNLYKTFNIPYTYISSGNKKLRIKTIMTKIKEKMRDDKYKVKSFD